MPLITGGLGDDVIACAAGVAADTTVNGGAGDDRITVTGGSVAGSVYGGAGADIIQVTAPTSTSDGVTAVTRTVRGGTPLLSAALDGNDTITASTATSSAGKAVTGTVIGDAGNDSITAIGGDSNQNPAVGVDDGGSVQGGAGADEITINGGSSDETEGRESAVGSTGEVRGGGLLDGTDIISLYSFSRGTLAGDGGDDAIRGPANGGSALGGAGDDLLEFNTNGEPGVGGTADGGEGNDDISVAENDKDVLGDGGDDTISVYIRNDGLVDGVTGIDQCTVTAGNAAVNCP
ncbi:hypothetical protein [Streptomyces yaizuensis]|uniref:Calcium-binding protein n=1 Tax=Streptomyces yaizuensis TaxID=2989713 RepID=A0ABQ5PBK3_9ACTN|nr:hypothetical protein [Streptomyces sp. YSPA8]GLF99875.1 hypothetical protein SYYSPA8_36280 [Streptomyces sp. YSPA8]